MDWKDKELTGKNNEPTGAEALEGMGIPYIGS
jgi:hypothetical protein